QRAVRVAQRLGGEVRVDDPQAAVHPAYGIGDLGGRTVLLDQTVRPGCQTAPKVRRPAVRGEHQHPALRKGAPQSRRHAETVESRRADIDDGGLGTEWFSRADHVGAVAEVGDDLEVGLVVESAAEDPPAEDLVIDQQQPDAFLQHGPPGTYSEREVHVPVCDWAGLDESTVPNDGPRGRAMGGFRAVRYGRAT